MKYLLLHNFEKLSKDKILNGYLSKGYNIIFDSDNDILIKNIDNKIIDEDTYIKVVISILKRNSFVNNSKGKVIDLSNAFIYAKKKGKFNIFDNNFSWHVRNIINKEMNN